METEALVLPQLTEAKSHLSFEFDAEEWVYTSTDTSSMSQTG